MRLRGRLTYADVMSTIGVTVSCAADTKVIGGGSLLVSSSSEGIYLTENRPLRGAGGSDGDRAGAWAVRVQT